MRFIGLDLDWSPKSTSGLAVADGDEFGLRLERLKLPKTDKEIVAAIEEAADGRPVFVAIDAPLVNPKAKRHCDDLIELLFGQFSTDQTIRRKGKWSGNKRGAAIVKALAERNINHDPELQALERGRKCFEVYPYPAMVVIFGVNETLRYKGVKHEDARWEGFQQFQRHLKDLEDLHVDKKFLEEDVATLSGQALDEYEDKLDAIFCAYVAYYAWRSPEKCEVLGNLQDGYILTPVLRQEER